MFDPNSLRMFRKYAEQQGGYQAQIPDMSRAYGNTGALGGAAIGGALGAGLGDLVADQSHRNFFNMRIPGSQRIENNEGRLAGGAIGSVLGGLAGMYGGADVAQKKRFEHTMELQRMQDRAEILRKMRDSSQG
jgi:outer membrane lipoprotein SlyB